MGKRKKYTVRFKLRKPDGPLDKKILFELLSEVTDLFDGLKLTFQGDGANYVFSIESPDDSIEILNEVKDFISKKHQEKLTAEQALESTGVDKLRPEPQDISLLDVSLRDLTSATVKTLTQRLIQVKKLGIRFLVKPCYAMGVRLENVKIEPHKPDGMSDEDWSVLREKETDGESESKV